MIYEPKEDSYLLQKFVKKYALGRVLDMGAGSGIQARTALQRTRDVLAVDINPEAVEHCKEQGIPALQSDLFDKVEGKFDVIIFNPPYLPRDEREDKESSLITTGGKKGSEVLERFMNNAGLYLADEGKILTVVSSLTPDAEKIITRNGFRFTILGKQSAAFEQLVVYLIERG
ncbi:MAG TPA: HemK2/MTQ2 family protein methyltransferase [Candidatus Nanoarchaeia archaeon]|nr:HemK2/MTQ2 family protein methyltransferase [Candidatus Nanoarchaeia archaeon]